MAATDGLLDIKHHAPPTRAMRGRRVIPRAFIEWLSAGGLGSPPLGIYILGSFGKAHLLLTNLTRLLTQEAQIAGIPR